MLYPASVPSPLSGEQRAFFYRGRVGLRAQIKEICDFSQIKSLTDLEKSTTEVIWQNFERLVGAMYSNKTIFLWK